MATLSRPRLTVSTSCTNCDSCGLCCTEATEGIAPQSLEEWRCKGIYISQAWTTSLLSLCTFRNVDRPTSNMTLSSCQTMSFFAWSLLVLAPFVTAHPREQPPCSTTSAQPTTVEGARFASATEIRHIVDNICHSGLRLPGSANHLDVVDYIHHELRSIPGLALNCSDFELANWQPKNNSMYRSARLTVDGKDVDIAAAIAYSLPTNGSAISGMAVHS